MAAADESMPYEYPAPPVAVYNQYTLQYHSEPLLCALNGLNIYFLTKD